jgi:hypothetical protein
MNNFAEMMMETYVSESLALRVQKIEDLRGSAPLYRDILDVNISETAHLVRKSALDAIYSFASGEVAQKLAAAAETLSMVDGINIKNARRRIADKLIEDNVYRF